MIGRLSRHIDRNRGFLKVSGGELVIAFCFIGWPLSLEGVGKADGSLICLARMHSGSKGKSGSTRPASKQSPSWVDYKPEQVEEIIVSLVNQGHNSSEIGAILRDQYGVPSVKWLCGKTIGAILEKHKLSPDLPYDLLNLIKKSVTQKRHMAENNSDKTANHGYELTVSKIRRLVKYYRKSGSIPSDWRYTPEIAELLVK